HLGREFVLVHQPADAQRRLKAERDLGLHVRELLLVELHAGQRLAELLAVEAVLAGAEPAILCRPENAPGNAVAGAIEAAERTGQAPGIRQKRVLADLDILHHHLAGDRGAQRQLAFDLGRRKALHALLQHEAADLVLAFGTFELRPDNEDIGDRRVGYPHLGAVEAIAARRLLGAGLLAARTGAALRVGQA